MAEPTTLENDALRLDIVAEPAVSLRLTDLQTGFRWECPGAPFVLHYWDASQFTVRACPVSHKFGWEFRLLTEEGRIALQCTWPRAACSLRAVFGLDGNCLVVQVPGRRLVENRPFHVRLMAVDVLADFGAARTSEPGFLLIPSGMGALCRFRRSEERSTVRLFHTDDWRPLTAPVFGVARGRSGFIWTAESGEFNAGLVITANGGPSHDLHSVSPRILTRLHPGDTLEDLDYSFRYVFLADDDATPAGMAGGFRRFLTASRGAPTLRDRMKLRPMLAQAANATTVHVLLAEKRRTTSMSGDGELHVLTRFDEVGRLAEEVRNAGVEKAVFVLAGWNCEGRDGLYPTRFPVESAVGGADAMSRAVAAVRALGFLTGAVDNYTDMYRRSPAFNKDFTAKQAGGDPWRGGVWAGGQSYVICPHQARERYVQRDMRRLRDLGLEGLLLLDHCPGPGVLRCYDPDHPLTRSEYAAELREFIKTAQATFGLCRVSDPLLFAALESDTCMVPVQDPPEISNVEPDWFVDEPVPFLPMVLHGSVLLAAEAEADPLRVAEYGAAPVFSVTGGDVSRVLSKLAPFHVRYLTELAPLAEHFVTVYETPAPGLVRVGYSNGAEVLVNRTEKTAEISGKAVLPRDFRVKSTS